MPTRKTVASYAIAAAAYVVGSFILMHHIFFASPSHGTTYALYDSSNYVYVNSFVAQALTHWHNPFYISAIHYPQGLNILAEPYDFALAVLFTPLTLVGGPVLAFNTQLLLIPILNGVVMMFAVRPWIKRTWITMVIGGAWAFSPFVVESLKLGWTNIALLVYPPIVLWCVCDLLVFKRHSARRLGVGLGLATVAQFFISTEILIISALATAFVLGCGWIATRLRHGKSDDETVRRWRVSTAWFIGVSVVLLAAPVAMLFAGPDPLAHWIRRPAFFKSIEVSLSSVVSGLSGPASLLPHFHQVVPNPNYLGVVLALATVAALVVVRRHALALPLLLLLVLGLWLARGYGSFANPEGIFLHIIVLHNLTISRFVIVVWFASLLLLGLLADHVVEVLGKTRTLLTASGAAGVLLAASLCAPAIADTTRGVMGYSTWAPDPAIAFVTSLPGPHRILTFPAPTVNRGLLNQAVSGDFSYALSGGTSLQIANLKGPYAPGEIWLEELTYQWQTSSFSKQQLQQIVALLDHWKTTDVVIPIHMKPNIGFGRPFEMTALMNQLLGPPRKIDHEWVWTNIHPRVPPLLK